MLRRALLAAAASEHIRGWVTATPATRAVVDRYVAGETISDAVRVARSLREDGLLVTLDHLGEDTTDPHRVADGLPGDIPVDDRAGGPRGRHPPADVLAGGSRQQCPAQHHNLPTIG